MEEDHEELLQYTDDESVSGTDEQISSDPKPREPYLSHFAYFHHTKMEFFITLILVIISSLTLTIVLPLYINALNIRGNVHSLILFNVPFSTLIFLIMITVWKFLCNKFNNRKIIRSPICIWSLTQISLIYITSIFLYIYSSDRNKVLCHFQDPIKSIVLVFALLYYFFFCRKFMGLRRIFSTTTVIVGLFIAVDYGLCDEFVCRGYDRHNASDDAGTWSWKIHATWTGLYIFGLTLLAAFFTILDRHVAPENKVSHNMITNSFLNTISSTVTESTSNLVPPESHENERREHNEQIKGKSALHFALWIHIFCLGILLFTFWIDFIPGIGKGNTVAESWNYTVQGILCHLKEPEDTKNEGHCDNVFWYMLIFQLGYIVFVVSSIKFLILSQSAVFTIATTTSALPLVGIWWTLFQATPRGLLLWSPKIRVEFVCSILGLPIVAIALGLLCIAHFEDSQRFFNIRMVSRRHPA